MDNSEAKRDRVLKEALNCRVELVAYARALLGEYATAEDAVQETMLVVVKKFEQFEEGTSMLAWCRAILRLEVLRAKRRKQRERTLAARLLDDAIDAAFEEFQAAKQRDNEKVRKEAMQQCFQAVPERGRRVLHARFVDELSYQQIGQRLDMSLEAVRKALYRLKKQVRLCVETKLEETQ